MNQLEYRRSIQLAEDFLTRCFAPGEFIALLLRREKPVSVTQRVVLLERAVTPRYLGWLAHENSAGANIYVAANPLRSGTRKRMKESVASVRHLYLDIDSDGEAKLAVLLNSDRVPKPTAIISTSPNKYQVLWRVEGFDFERQESTLKLLALTFGGDPACTDCNRVLRVPGFFNLKYNPAHLVAIQYPDTNTSDVDDFRLDISATNPMMSKPHIPPTEHTGKQSNSELDWAWVLQELAGGKDAVRLTRELASRRSDKPSPLYYAQRTVDVASARLWLLEGIRLDDVVTMLEVRRRFEVPSSICSARAREIALTVQRMIARTKSA
jgi:RepB DNA-primase from phage plasmid